MTPRHGEIWRARFAPLGSTAGHEHGSTFVAVIQSERRRYGKTLLCVPLTTNRARERPYGILIRRDTRNELARDSVAMPWLTIAVDVANLEEAVGRLQDVDIDRIREMMLFLITPDTPASFS